MATFAAKIMITAVDGHPLVPKWGTKKCLKEAQKWAFFIQLVTMITAEMVQESLDYPDHDYPAWQINDIRKYLGVC